MCMVVLEMKHVALQGLVWRFFECSELEFRFAKAS